MSAVSRKVTPLSMAASRTFLVAASSRRPPKLLQPRPITDAWRLPMVRVRIPFTSRGRSYASATGTGAVRCERLLRRVQQRGVEEQFGSEAGHDAGTVDDR